MVENEGNRSTKCFCGTNFRAFIAENALRSVFPLAGFLVDLHIHGADAQALAAADAFAFVTVDTQQGEIAHGLEEHRDGTQVFTERPVILARECQRNARDVIEGICNGIFNHTLLCEFHQGKRLLCSGRAEIDTAGREK